MICLAVFIVTLAALVLTKFDETAIVLLSMSICAIVTYVIGGLSFSVVLGYVGWDTILFIMAMMIIISVLGSSGMFQYMALIIAGRAKGDPKKLYMMFMVLVFLISLFIHPLPTILIMGAFTVEVCNGLDIDFRPFLISEAVVANSGSIATPIASIPDMIIVSVAKMDVGLMFIVLFPLSLFLLFLTILYFLRYYRDAFVPSPTLATTDLFMVEPSVMIRSRFDFYVSVLALAVLMTGLVLIPNESAIVGLLVAAALLVLSFDRAKDLLNRLSWDTVFFVVGLFGIVAALEATGVVEDLVNALGVVGGSNVFVAIVMMIWLPGLVLSTMDNVPIAALLAPTVAQGTVLGSLSPVVSQSLILGVNASVYVVPFGDAPNYIVLDIAERNRRPITWTVFTRATFPLGILHLVIATIYLSAVAMLL